MNKISIQIFIIVLIIDSFMKYGQLGNIRLYFARQYCFPLDFVMTAAVMFFIVFAWMNFQTQTVTIQKLMI